MNEQWSLILGGTGVVGRYLRRHLGVNNAVSTYCQHPFEQGEYFDAASMRVGDLLARYPRITHAFVLFGMTNIDDCARRPDESTNINVTSTLRVLADLAAANVVPVFTSSDAVFDGSSGNRTESDVPMPILTYGRQKLHIEQYLLNHSSPSIIVRLSKVVDPEIPEGDWLGDWVRRLVHGEEIRAARDQVFSPVDANDVASGLVTLAQQRASGLFHMGGPESCSRLDFLKSWSQAAMPHIAGRPLRLESCSIRDFPFVEKRPLDTSLSSTRLYQQLGRPFIGIDAMCARVVQNQFRQKPR